MQQFNYKTSIILFQYNARFIFRQLQILGINKTVAEISVTHTTVNILFI